MTPVRNTNFVTEFFDSVCNVSVYPSLTYRIFWRIVNDVFCVNEILGINRFHAMQMWDIDYKWCRVRVALFVERLLEAIVIKE